MPTLTTTPLVDAAYDIDASHARVLDLAGNDNRNWVNDHTVYTHGYGVVAAYGNR